MDERGFGNDRPDDTSRSAAASCDDKTFPSLVRERSTITQLEFALLTGAIGLVLIAVLHSFGGRSGNLQAASPSFANAAHSAGTTAVNQR
jgi:hypothetical protein